MPMKSNNWNASTESNDIGVLRTAIFKYLLAIILCFQMEMIAPSRVPYKQAHSTQFSMSVCVCVCCAMRSRTLYRIDVVSSMAMHSLSFFPSFYVPSSVFMCFSIDKYLLTAFDFPHRNVWISLHVNLIFRQSIVMAKRNNWFVCVCVYVFCSPHAEIYEECSLYM